MQRGDITSLSPAASKGAHSFFSKTHILSAAKLNLSFLIKVMELMQYHRAAERTKEENLGGKKSGSIRVILFPASLPPGWLIRAISPSNLARRVSVLPLLPASCPALISFISKEGRDFL